MAPEVSVLRSGNLIVTPVVAEFLLAKAYITMVEEGTLDVVFYQSAISLRDFLEAYLTHGKRITLGCFRELPDGRMEFCGMGWAHNAEKMASYVKSECGMVFFKKQSSKRDNVAFGKLMLQSFFTQHNVDVIFGTTPEPNKLALRYAQKLGFDLIGPIPNYCSWHGELAPGWVSHISKSQWEERNRS